MIVFPIRHDVLRFLQILFVRVRPVAYGFGNLHSSLANTSNA